MPHFNINNHTSLHDDKCSVADLNKNNEFISNRPFQPYLSNVIFKLPTILSANTWENGRPQSGARQFLQVSVVFAHISFAYKDSGDGKSSRKAALWGTAHHLRVIFCSFYVWVQAWAEQK